MICPKCEKEIDHLEYSYSGAHGTGTYDEEGLHIEDSSKENEVFCCPRCRYGIADYEYQAYKFVNGRDQI